jgi:hypothetical protein
MALYQYTGLEPRHIRLLQLRQDAPTNKIMCTFTVVSLDALDTVYTAISYCWGDDALTERVWFGHDQFLTINKSARDILGIAVSNGFSGYCWIDSVCIDQTNDDEKAQQVDLMGEVYSLARQVTGFLGTPSADSDIAMRFAGTLHNRITDLFRSGTPITQGAFHGSAICGWPSPEWSALGRLLKRAWFHRLWIIQEVVVARRVSLRCAGETIAWNTLAEVVSALFGNGMTHLLTTGTHDDDSLPPAMVGVRNILSVYSFRMRRESGSPIRLQSQLLECRVFGATNPRDRIFALRGFVTDGDDPALFPDYKSTTEAVFTRCAKRLLARDGSLELLHGAGIGFPRSLTELPSWVPDLINPPVGTILGAIAATAQYRSAGDTAVHVVELGGVEASDRPALAMTGRFVDKVKTVCQMNPRRDDGSGAREELDWLRQCKDTIDSLAPYPTDEPTEEVLWRTLIANVSFAGGPGQPAPNEYGRYFASYEALRRLQLEHERDVRSDMPHLAPDAAMWTAVWGGTIKRALFTTNRGYAGLGPPGMQVGDSIGIIHGGATPFLLRNVAQPDANSGSKYVLVGECYIHGIMNGELVGVAMAESIVLV